MKCDSLYFSIIEGVNLDTQNQMTLHTRAGCLHPTLATGAQTGTMGATDCSQAGCTVLETKDNSFGQGFVQNGGGVYAAKFDISGFVEFIFRCTSIDFLSPSILYGYLFFSRAEPTLIIPHHESIWFFPVRFPKLSYKIY